MSTATGAAPAAEGSRLGRRNRIDLALDAFLIVTFVVGWAVGFTGLTVHEWLGLLLGATLLLHIVRHADWVRRTASRLRGRLPGRTRVLAVVDLLLFVVMTLVVVSGIAVSRRALPGVGGRDRFWDWLHTESARAVALLVAVHVALGWEWLVKVAGAQRRRSRRQGRPGPGARSDR